MFGLGSLEATVLRGARPVVFERQKKKHWVSHNAWALEDENKARIRVPDLDGRGVYVCSECDDRAISPDDGHNAATRIVT